MGKWAQSRKRGSSAGPVITLPAPTKPALADIDDAITQSAQGTPDVGGIITLESAPTALGPWTPVNTAPWQDVYSWGDHADYLGLVLRCKETGNGVDFAGDSEWSEILVVT